MKTPALWFSRSTIPHLALAAAVALGSSACKGPSITGSEGAPNAVLGGQSGSPVITATYPNPCEIDVDFGNVPIGLSDSANIKIQNTGSSTLDLNQVSPNLDPEFSLNYSQQPPIQPGESDQFSVTFQPYKVGPVQSTFTIQTDGVNDKCPAPSGPSSGQSVVTVQLIGNGIQLSLVVEPNVLDFGNTLINTTVKKSVTLTNKSTAPVSGITATLGGGDSARFTVDNAPSTLNAGEAATVDISYSPVAIEVRSLATVTFVGSDQETATVNLFGEPVGVALTIEPNPINFGYVPLETPAIGCTTISNQANVTVNISGVINFDTESNAFSVSPTDDATLRTRSRFRWRSPGAPAPSSASSWIRRSPSSTRPRPSSRPTIQAATIRLSS